MLKFLSSSAVFTDKAINNNTAAYSSSRTNGYKFDNDSDDESNQQAYEGEKERIGWGCFKIWRHYFGNN